jgi:hypothetical protein
MFILSKEKRNNIIDKLTNDFKKGKLSDKSLGILIRSFHASTPVSLLFLSLFAPRYVVNCIVAFLVVVFFLFFIFGGCFLTMVENKICNDDFTIADIFLESLEWEKNSKNRFNISCIIGGSYCVVVAIIYYIRFYFDY